MKTEENRGKFTGSIGFVLAAAGSAVGLGNIWRFPYLAAKDGGGLFILCYIILVFTFGFALLATEIAIGRKTGRSPLTAYKELSSRWGWIGVLACLIPSIILPYYCTIGGWVLKYFSLYVTDSGREAVADGYFTSFISSTAGPAMWMVIFLLATAFIVYRGVNSGIEKFSTVLMPILLVLLIFIAVFSLTLQFTDENGVTRTGLEGLKVYLVPDFSGLTLSKLFTVVTDALGQLFFSISVAMGIMVAYGSYVKKDANLGKSVNQIEFFDTSVALLAGMMVIPAVFTFMGREGMSAGPGLMFVSLPKIFEAMGPVSGRIVGIAFFLMVIFAALTSSVSVMEAIVASVMDKFRKSRHTATVLVTAITLVIGLVVCFGYNIFYFELTLPNGSAAQILDVLDYISNYLLMPLTALFTCILIGWVVQPKTIIDEITHGGYPFGREKLYIIMIKYVAPVMLFVLLLQSIGILNI